jgi:hypothetical protein
MRRKASPIGFPAREDRIDHPGRNSIPRYRIKRFFASAAHQAAANKIGNPNVKGETTWLMQSGNCPVFGVRIGISASFSQYL